MEDVKIVSDRHFISAKDIDGSFVVDTRADCANLAALNWSGGARVNESLAILFSKARVDANEFESLVNEVL